MTILNHPLSEVEYPDEDGQPMAEGDAQRDSLLSAVSTLGHYFQPRPDVYVSGNLFIYYEQGNPEAVVAPDVFVIFGVSNRRRRSYKVWEEKNRVPNFVLEITSKTTRSKDQGAKKGIYAFLGVEEYFQYDPTGDYLQPQLQGHRLAAGNYYPISSTVSDEVSLRSEVLGLDLRLEAGTLRFYNPVRGDKLLTYEESEQARQAAEARIAELEAQLRAIQEQPPQDS